LHREGGVDIHVKKGTMAEREKVQKHMRGTGTRSTAHSKLWGIRDFRSIYALTPVF